MWQSLINLSRLFNHIITGPFWRKVTNDNKYCVDLVSEDFDPHKWGLWVCLWYFYPMLQLSLKQCYNTTRFSSSHEVFLNIDSQWKPSTRGTPLFGLWCGSTRKSIYDISKICTRNSKRNGNYLMVKSQKIACPKHGRLYSLQMMDEQTSLFPNLSNFCTHWTSKASGAVCCKIYKSLQTWLSLPLLLEEAYSFDGIFRIPSACGIQLCNGVS